MKKTTFLLIALILLLRTVQAQSSFGIAAGPTFATIKAKFDGISLTSKTKTGFSAGIIYSTALGKNFSFRPELNFVQKGGTLKVENETFKTSMNYLELPLNFVYNTHSTKGKFFVGAGPFLGVGLSGKNKFSDGINPEVTEDVKLGSGDDADYKSFEFGLDAVAGYQFNNGIFFAANYNWGISNIAPSGNGPTDDSEKDYNRYFGIKIGYMFHGKKK